MGLNDIKLWEKNLPDADLGSSIADLNNRGLPTLTPYLLKEEKLHPAIIVCPGGAFQYRASHEGEPIAKWLNQMGMNAFVLNYRVAPYTPFTATKDAVRAVRYLRYNALKFNIDPERIGMIGFSAGGYLAAFLGTHFDNEMIEPESRNAQMMSILFGELNCNDPIDQTSSKLNALILCYAETSPFSKEKLPAGSLLPKDIAMDELIDFTSNHKHVTAKTPPTFLWVTANDDFNFQRQNLLFAQALSEQNLSFEFHIFSKGQHGLGLGKDEPAVAIWPKLCENWLRGLWP
ncbi:acetyl esterase/lipase [Hydrogenispora ethanolica]|uniref:Acetyl esterase/lipase n=1 Tax=Hydrogenispora ethanolica TaxID=1082276 RepID=A0A4R1R017_HYDET|nr:alpha/beta hydrolase [Hydrogenispora ethanolica]TCL58614.1 acetyl esterase/lipase [Hydrogenispora ethanolica]